MKKGESPRSMLFCDIVAKDLELPSSGSVHFLTNGLERGMDHLISSAMV